MSSASPHEARARSRRRAYLIAAQVGVGLVVAGAVGAWLLQRYDPFFVQRPAVREAKALLDAASRRSLTDEEFSRAIGLLDVDTPFARVSAVTVLEVEAGRSPERRARAVEALERCRQTTDVTVSRAAAQALARLRPEPKGP
ncbi:MAG: hypothetical protein K2X82_26035 [Gemmataceae bacterium]|nr:hypothetical protein [Gemmataceae bacterium]